MPAGCGASFDGRGLGFFAGGRVDADVVFEETEFFQDFLRGGRGVPFEG